MNAIDGDSDKLTTNGIADLYYYIKVKHITRRYGEEQCFLK